MRSQDIDEFCHRWLLAWTGYRTEKLVEFYSADAYYRDPARTEQGNERASGLLQEAAEEESRLGMGCQGNHSNCQRFRLEVDSNDSHRIPYGHG